MIGIDLPFSKPKKSAQPHGFWFDIKNYEVYSIGYDYTSNNITIWFFKDGTSFSITSKCSIEIYNDLNTIFKHKTNQR